MRRSRQTTRTTATHCEVGWCTRSRRLPMLRRARKVPYNRSESARRFHSVRRPSWSRRCRAKLSRSRSRVALATRRTRTTTAIAIGACRRPTVGATLGARVSIMRPIPGARVKARARLSQDGRFYGATYSSSRKLYEIPDIICSHGQGTYMVGDTGSIPTHS